MLKVNRGDVADKLLAMVSRTAPGRVVTTDSKLQADLGLDSLDSVDLVMQIEEEFRIEVPDADWEDGPDRTVGELAELIATKLEASGRARHGDPATDPRRQAVHPGLCRWDTCRSLA